MNSKNKKKGFTLIEVIAAIAILSIGLVGISNIMSTSIKITKQNDVKMKCMAFANDVIENFKGEDPQNIGDMKDKTVTIYFNDERELTDGIQSFKNSLSTTINSNKKYSACVKFSVVSEDSLVKNNSTKLNIDKFKIVMVDVEVKDEAYSRDFKITRKYIIPVSE